MSGGALKDIYPDLDEPQPGETLLF